jgi:hypothetical protein
MSSNKGLTTTQIQAVFAEEIGAVGGTVSDTFNDGSRLFSRSILPQLGEVRPGDAVQGGVALKATEQDIWVHPYIFRLVCTNGAVMAHAIQTRHIATMEMRTPEEVGLALREALRACSAREAFASASEEMRSAAEAQVDIALNLMPLLSHLSSSPDVTNEILMNIMDQFFESDDTTLFGLMNAVTSVARDTPDPDLRWRLEEFGGGIPVARVTSPVRDDSAAKRLEEREERELLLV